jgi:hypothetical protein
MGVKTYHFLNSPACSCVSTHCPLQRKPESRHHVSGCETWRRYCEPDFVALISDGTYYIVETKGLEDVNVANKGRAAQLLCENTTRFTGKPWAHAQRKPQPPSELVGLELECIANVTGTIGPSSI